MSSLQRSCDVLVAGAGPAGAVAAALLARAGRRVLLVDPHNDIGPKVGECLPMPAAQLLKRLGLPGPEDGGPHQRISGVCSLWGDNFARQDAFNELTGAGWRLDRRRFDRDLRSAALDLGASVLHDVIDRVARDGSDWRLRTAHETTLCAKIIVDATGRRARLARRLGIRQHADQPTVAIWAVGDEVAGEHSAQTLVESCTDGWWYGAYLPGGAPIAIFHCAPSIAVHLSNNPHAWRERLSRTQIIADTLNPGLFGTATVRRADARGLMLDSVSGQDWFACGDAAISFNPLSSQGLFNAIASAAMVAGSIREDQPSISGVRYRERMYAVRARYLRHLQALERERHHGDEHATASLRASSMPLSKDRGERDTGSGALTDPGSGHDGLRALSSR